MTVGTIDFQLDDDTVRLFSAASGEDRQKLQVLLGFRGFASGDERYYQWNEHL